MTNTIIIWQFCDLKPGHENQSKGLIQAIKSRVSADSHRIIVPSSLLSFLFSLFTGSLYRQLAQLPKPSHLIAAGRRTHLPMLLAHLWFGGRRIVLMRSLWPKNWFDHMIIPAHDAPKDRHNIFTTQGVINNIIPSVNHNSHSGMLLIGGPSKHYHWDTDAVISQLSEIISATPEISWQLANSRRTPADFFDKFGSILPQSQLIDYNSVDSGWLASQLAVTGQIWVSPDSVSMVYESLTSGALVGSLLLEESQTNNRVVKGIDMLIDQNMLTSFEQWQTTHTLSPPSHRLYEAQQAADWILNQ
ncbi:mitochondrial fission ELM1 family protein [Pseudomonadota bacterium]|nr:mitochondrial fission ELM1 family protein [Pseudomonadota bacterium]